MNIRPLLSPGARLLEPVPLAAIVMLFVNDHWLKAAWPGAVTGKVSDVAGLVFFPLFLVALTDACARSACRLHKRLALRAVDGARVLFVAALATCLVFTLVKTVPFANRLYGVGLAALQWPARALFAILRHHAVPTLGRAGLAADPTDLFALPAAFLLPVLRARHGARDVMAALLFRGTDVLPRAVD